MGIAFRRTRGVRGEAISPLNPSGLPHPSDASRGRRPLKIPRGLGTGKCE